MLDAGTLAAECVQLPYRKDYIAVQRPSTHDEKGEPRVQIRSQLAVIKATELERLDGSRLAFGQWPVADITTATITQFQSVRLTKGTTAANRDLGLLRHAFYWAIIQDHVERTPFKKRGEVAVRLTKETKRSRRLQAGEAERLLAACGEHLRAIVEAAIETGCRRGELLSLQWSQVRFEPKAEIVLPAHKTKTRSERRVPMSTRLRAILEMRQAALAQKLEIDLEKSQTIPGDKYVFGNELGEPVKGFKRAWERAVLKAHGHRPTYRVRIVGEGKAARKVPTAALTAESRAALRRIGLHFHDLRREAGSRWLERGLSLHQVRDLLGHSNIAQTSTYLAADAGDIHEAMRRAEARVSALPPIATDSEKGVINASQGSTVANSATQESSARHH